MKSGVRGLYNISYDEVAERIGSSLQNCAHGFESRSRLQLN